MKTRRYHNQNISLTTWIDFYQALLAIGSQSFLLQNTQVAQNLMLTNLAVFELSMIGKSFTRELYIAAPQKYSNLKYYTQKNTWHCNFEPTKNDIIRYNYVGLSSSLWSVYLFEERRPCWKSWKDRSNDRNSETSDVSSSISEKAWRGMATRFAGRED